MEKLMNKEIKWDHRISAGVEQVSADCIRFDEVAAALKKMKRESHTFVRYSWLWGWVHVHLKCTK